METIGNENATFDNILRQLTTEQLKFVVARQSCTSDADAARQVGIGKGTVSRWPDIVQQAVKLMALDGVHVAQEMLRRSLNDAIEVKISGLQNRNAHIQQDAATEIIDRTLGKPTQRTELTGKDGGSIPIEVFDKTLRRVYGTDSDS